MFDGNPSTVVICTSLSKNVPTVLCERIEMIASWYSAIPPKEKLWYNRGLIVILFHISASSTYATLSPKTYLLFQVIGEKLLYLDTVELFF